MNTFGLKNGFGLRTTGALTALTCLVLAAGCGSDASGGGGPGEDKHESASSGDVLRGTIGAKGGELVGAVGSALEGVKLTVPEGALASDTAIEIRPSTVASKTPLPT